MIRDGLYRTVRWPLLSVVGLFGLDFGEILHHTAGAISSLVGVLLGLSITAHFLPGAASCWPAATPDPCRPHWDE